MMRTHLFFSNSLDHDLERLDLLLQLQDVVVELVTARSKVGLVERMRKQWTTGSCHLLCLNVKRLLTNVMPTGQL